ncbi:helix-turn-helix domain-containing protein [Escherichia coli]
MRWLKKLGVTRVAISKAEQGLTKSFNGDTLFKVAAALQCSPQWLQNGDEKGKHGKIMLRAAPRETRHTLPCN